MSYSVIFKITGGSFERGFRIETRIKRNRKTIQTIQGILPLESTIPELYNQTFTNYIEWGRGTRLGARSIIDGDAPESIGANINQCLEASRQLSQTFQACMRQANLAENLGNIQDYIDIHIPKNANPMFFLEVPDLDASDDNLIFQRLPLHTWDWLRDTFKTEVVLSRNAREIVALQKWWLFPRKRLRILVILGAETNIDLTPDRKAVETYLRPITSKLRVLEQPTLIGLRQEISGVNYDGIIFSGHSDSSQSGSIGTITINNYETIAIDQIRTQLRQAQRNGLKFLVLNSCNGIGSASQASEFIDYIIVMREPIQNQVAAIFISHCLEHLSQGDSLTRSVSKARKQLEQQEDKYICASWMPVIVQNQEAPDYIPFPNKWNKFSSNISKSDMFIYFSTLPIWRKSSTGDKKDPKQRFIGLVLLLLLGIGSCFAIPGLLGKFNPESICQFAAHDTETNISCGEDIESNAKLYSSRNSLDFSSFELIKHGLKNKVDTDKKTNEKRRISLDNYWMSKDRNPEIKIAIENFQAIQDSYNNPAVKIKYIAAVVSRIDSNSSYVANALLRGIAMRQEEYNNMRRNDGEFGRIVILIATDDNGDNDNKETNKKHARDIAEKLANRKDIYAVIGHYSSQKTLDVIDIYKRTGKLLISPTATSHKLSKQEGFIRVVPSTTVYAQYMVDHWGTYHKKMFLFYTSEDAYSKSLTEKFQESLKPYNIVPELIDFANPNHDKKKEINIKQKIEDIKKDKDNSIVLFGDAYVASSDTSRKFFEVIEHNNNRLPILSNTCIYDIYEGANFSGVINDKHPLYKYSRRELYDNVVMALPWDYSEEKYNGLIPEEKIKNGLSSKKDHRIEIPEWVMKEPSIGTFNQRTAFAYDATLVLSKSNENHFPKDIYGITGVINIENSDRQEKMASLITPDVDHNGKHRFKRYSNKDESVSHVKS
jgi:branched-chain amino acid transport system substrate-binding protein